MQRVQKDACVERVCVVHWSELKKTSFSVAINDVDSAELKPTAFPENAR